MNKVVLPVGHASPLVRPVRRLLTLIPLLRPMPLVTRLLIRSLRISRLAILITLLDLSSENLKLTANRRSFVGQVYRYREA